MNPESAALTVAEQIGPWIPVIVTAAGALIVGIWNAWNRRKGSQESKTPTVQQIWDEQRKQRIELNEANDKLVAQGRLIGQVQRDRDAFSSAFTGLRETFLRFVERVQAGGSLELTIAEHRALEIPVTGDDYPEDDTASS